MPALNRPPSPGPAAAAAAPAPVPAWLTLPPPLECLTRLACLLVALFVASVLALDHAGLERGGRRIARAGFAKDPGLDAVQTAIEQYDEAALRRAAARTGLDLNALDAYGKTPLGRAARSGWLAGCRILLEHGDADAGRRDDLGCSPLLYTTLNGGCDRAATAGELIDLLLRHGADPNERGSRGTTPLLYAAYGGNVEQAARLIRAGADVNAAADDGATPLHAAATRNSAAVAALLLENGADPAARDDTGRTPLGIARADGAAAAARVLESARLAPAKFARARARPAPRPCRRRT